jgi:hypothetical protein
VGLWVRTCGSKLRIGTQQKRGEAKENQQSSQRERTTWEVVGRASKENRGQAARNMKVTSKQQVKKIMRSGTTAATQQQRDNSSETTAARQQQQRQQQRHKCENATWRVFRVLLSLEVLFSVLVCYKCELQCWNGCYAVGNFECALKLHQACQSPEADFIHFFYFFSTNFIIRAPL